MAKFLEVDEFSLKIIASGLIVRNITRSFHDDDDDDALRVFFLTRNAIKPITARGEMWEGVT